VNFNWGVGSLITGITKEDLISAEWNGFLKVDSTGSYTFSVHVNDGVRVYIDQNLVIDQWTTVTDEVKGQIIESDSIDLQQDTFLPITVQYYENTGSAFLSLMWRLDDESDQVIASDNLYYVADNTPISGENNLVSAYFTPRKATDLYQSDSSTYAESQITLMWTAPTDTGCLDIESYLIEAFINDLWETVGTSIITEGIADLSA
jgi:hypothetical protein